MPPKNNSLKDKIIDLLKKSAISAAAEDSKYKNCTIEEIAYRNLQQLSYENYQLLSEHFYQAIAVIKEIPKNQDAERIATQFLDIWRTQLNADQKNALRILSFDELVPFNNLKLLQDIISFALTEGALDKAGQCFEKYCPLIYQENYNGNERPFFASEIDIDKNINLRPFFLNEEALIGDLEKKPSGDFSANSSSNFPQDLSRKNKIGSSRLNFD